MAKGKKLSEEKEATLSKELTIEKKYQCLQTVLHSRMEHVETIYITEDGNFYFSKGHELRAPRDLNPENAEDAKLINSTGKRRIIEIKPGTYINRKRVVDEISVEDFKEDKEDIIKGYAAFLKEQREKKKADMVANPDATAEMLAEMIKTGSAKTE